MSRRSWQPDIIPYMGDWSGDRAVQRSKSCLHQKAGMAGENTRQRVHDVPGCDRRWEACVWRVTLLVAESEGALRESKTVGLKHALSSAICSCRRHTRSSTGLRGRSSVKVSPCPSPALQFELGACEITVGHVETTEHVWPGSLVQRGILLLLT